MQHVAKPSAGAGVLATLLGRPGAQKLHHREALKECNLGLEKTTNMDCLGLNGSNLFCVPSLLPGHRDQGLEDEIRVLDACKEQLSAACSARLCRHAASCKSTRNTGHTESWPLG